MLIFGCSINGKMAYDHLSGHGETIRAFMDNAPALWGRTYRGIPIVPPSEYAGTDELVLITPVNGARSVIEDINRLNIRNYASYTDYIRREELSPSALTALEIHARHIKREIELASRENKGELTLSSVDLVITECCSLRCRDCANLMQYFAHPKNDDYDTTTRAFDRLYSLTDWIYEVRIIGGDAMVSKRLPDYLRFLQDYHRISDIVIYTNGIIMPGQPLLSALKDKRVSVYITDYAHPAQRLNEITEAFSGVNVPVFIKTSVEWQDCAQIYRRGRTIDQLKKVMSECCVKTTVSLKEGMLWRCPLAGSMFALNAAPADIHEYVNLLGEADDEALKRDIAALMELPYLKICDFCGGRPVHNDNPIPAAVQADKPLDYVRYV